jgi:hypothetical protein
MLKEDVKENKINLQSREGERHVNVRAISQDCEL